MVGVDFSALKSEITKTQNNMGCACKNMVSEIGKAQREIGEGFAVLKKYFEAVSVTGMIFKIRSEDNDV